jgi:basic membrane protein A and related proteins
MRRRFLSLIGVLAMFSLVAAACGSSTDSATKTTEGSSTTAKSTDGSSATAKSGSETTATTAKATDAAGSFVTLDQRCTEVGKVTLPADYNVVLVTDVGKIDDGTFNQYAYEGMKGAEKCFGFKTSYIETASEADYAKNIATALSSQPEVIITVGFLLATDTLAAAKANPKVHFVGVDQFHDAFPDNYAGVLFNEHEGGYMVGALAATLSKSGVIGVVAGRQDVPPVVKFVNGYTKGAKSVNPNIRVLSIYNESFTDTAKGASDAQQFIGEGADVIFGAGGQTGSGGVKAAAEAKLWGIGVDKDEWFTTFAGGSAPGADHLATSAIKRVDLSVFDNVAADLGGKFKSGAFVLTAKNLGITYAPFHKAAIPDAAAKVLEKTRAGLADGSIDTGVCGIDGLFVGEKSLCG